jgi:hypothetical protein
MMNAHARAAAKRLESYEPTWVPILKLTAERRVDDTQLLVAVETSEQRREAPVRASGRIRARG